MFPVDPLWGGYPQVDLTAHPGSVDVRMLHKFVRGLAPATRAAVAETVQPLPGQKKTDLPTIRRVATAGGTTCRARRSLPLPDPKPATRGTEPRDRMRQGRLRHLSTLEKMSGRPTVSSLREAPSPWEADLPRQHQRDRLEGSQIRSRTGREPRVV